MVAPDRRAEASLRCVPAADLTAFAQGALPEPRRAEISRHLLRCPRCNATATGAGDLLGRLRSFGAMPSWERELDAAVEVAHARTRARGLGALAGAGVGVLLAAGVAFLPSARAPDVGPSFAQGPGAAAGTAPLRGSSRPAPAAPTLPPWALSGEVPGASPGPVAPLSDDARALLRAQATDGRWTADGALGGDRHDEAATGLALLAILEGRPGALRDPGVARAVAAATRWLRGRERGLDGTPAALRDDAVTTSALLAVYAQTGDPGIRASADRGVRRLARELVGGSTLDAASAGWARVALARARDLGWDRGLPSDDGAPTAYPLGGTPGETLVAKALAFVDRSPRG